jgi:hypothetical protein
VVHLSLVVLRACPPDGPDGSAPDSGYRAASGQPTVAERLTTPRKASSAAALPVMD